MARFGTLFISLVINFIAAAAAAPQQFTQFGAADLPGLSVWNLETQFPKSETAYLLPLASEDDDADVQSDDDNDDCSTLTTLDGLTPDERLESIAIRTTDGMIRRYFMRISEVGPPCARRSRVVSPFLLPSIVRFPASFSETLTVLKSPQVLPVILTPQKTLARAPNPN